MDVITICVHYLAFLKDRQILRKHIFIALIACSYLLPVQRVLAENLDLQKIERLSLSL